MTMFTCALVAMLVVMPACIFAALSDGWMTNFDARFTFQCRDNQILTYIEAVHYNKHEDRVWKFKCSDLPAPTKMQDCKWSGWVNEYDQPMAYHCPGEGVIAGIDSKHSNKKEDRLFAFLCCQPGDYMKHSCNMTAYVNDFDGHLDFTVPAYGVLSGVYSIHHNKEEDRIFKFDVCKLDPIDKEPIKY